MMTKRAEFSRKQVARIISNLVEEYKQNFPSYIENAKDINCGFCFHFALRLSKMLQNSIVCDTIWNDGDQHSHSFVFANGLFYDSETPSGVSDYLNMPYYVRESPYDGIIFCTDPLNPPEDSWRSQTNSGINGTAYLHGWVSPE